VTALRYAIVGAIAFVIDLGCLLLLVDRLPLVAANTIAFIVANLANFGLGHVWVFRQPLRGPGLKRQYLSVLAISVAGLALNDLLVWAGVVVAGADVVVAKVAATLVAMSWNFMARRRWVYRAT
jgi:putative flippase GtrA